VQQRNATAAKPAGVVVTATASGRVVEADTLQCVHCGMHWIVEPGSGRRRGWCTKCNGPLCHSKELCTVMCYPLEKRLDDVEKHGRLILP